MVLEAITEAGKKIKGYEQLPGISQVALVLAEIEAARQVSVPLEMIQQAMAEAGSKVSLRYLREALSVARARAKKAKAQAEANNPPSPTGRQPQITSSASKASLVTTPELPRSTKLQKDEKASRYVDSPESNPLYRRQKAKEQTST